MNVLVASASRHGSTHDVAERVAGVLAVRGHDVVVREVPDVTVDDLARADAVVLGSAVYRGRWADEALALVRAHADLLDHRAVWLFSTGPAGPRHDAPPLADLGELLATTRARGHRTFGGRVELRLLDARERLAAAVLGLEDGDHRDHAAIERWAGQVADELDEEVAHGDR